MRGEGGGVRVVVVVRTRRPPETFQTSRTVYVNAVIRGKGSGKSAAVSYHLLPQREQCPRQTGCYPQHLCPL